jgi:hypothetical protein
MRVRTANGLRWGGIAALACLAIIGAGCHGGAAAPSSLKERAAAYWGLKQSKGWDEVYDKYLDPDAKKTVTKEAFLKRRWLAFDILSYEISEIQETGDKATVAVTNEVNFPLKTPQGELQFIKKQVTTKDPWVKREGVWYVVLTE